MKNFINTDPKKISVGLEVVFYEEGDYMVAYCPALDLSSFGKDENDAKNSFVDALDIFIEETHKRGTLEKILLDLGWSLRKKPSADYKPPMTDDMIKLKYPHIIQNKINKTVLIPL